MPGREKTFRGGCEKTLQVFARLANRQTRKAPDILTDEQTNELWIPASIIPKRPTDCLPDEKFLFLPQYKGILFQPSFIRSQAPAQLVEHRRSPNPKVRMGDPFIHDPLNIRVELRLQDHADHSGKPIHCFPPGVTLQKLPNCREVFQFQEAIMLLEKIDGRVSILPLRLFPEKPGCLNEFRAICRFLPDQVSHRLSPDRG